MNFAHQPEPTALQSAEVATPVPETAQAAEAALLVEAPEASEPVQVAEAADVPPADAAPSQSVVIAALNARLEALRDAAAAPDPEATVEDTQPALPVAEVAAQPADMMTPAETSLMAIAEATAPAAETAQAEAAPDENSAVAAWPELEQSEPHASPSPVDDSGAFTTAMLTAAQDVPPEATATAAPWSHTAIEIQHLSSDLADAAVPPSDQTPHTDASANDAVEALARAVELALAAQPTSNPAAEPATPAAEIAQETAQESAQPESASGIEPPQANETLQAVETTNAIEGMETTGVQSPTDAAPGNGPVVAVLSARMAALRAAEAGRVIEAPPAEAGHPAETTVAAPARGPSVTVHESALLASLQQMVGTRPFPPPDEGTAVIFAPKPEFEFLEEFQPGHPAPSETVSGPEQAAAPQTETEPAAITPMIFEPAAAVRLPEAPPSIESDTAPAEPAMRMTFREAIQAVAAEPAPTVEAAVHAEPAVPIEPTVEAAPDTAESDFDPAAFLFGPEPEPDPAAFLLDPEPPPTPQANTTALPQPEFAAPAKPTAEKPEALQPVEPGQPTPPKSETAPRDPLHALKAMSENEKIALFS